MEGKDPQNLISVAVPRQHYEAVILFLARLMSGDPAPGSTAEGRWTPEELRRLRLEPLTSTVRALLDLTCEAPGTPIALSQVQRRARAEYAQARGHLGAFTKLLRRRFGRTDWPVRVVQGDDGKLCYIATPEVAEEWTTKHSKAS